MRTLLLTLLIAISTSYGQTKEELINAIIKVNSLDDWDGIIDRPFPGQIENNIEKAKISSNNYYNFNKLKEIISREELINLTSHKNQVLRLYAIKELIEKNDIAFDLKKIIVEEIKNKKYINVHSGCIISQELSYSILYHAYWNQVRINARDIGTENNEKKEEVAMQKAVENDKLLKEINVEIIKLDKDIYWLIYERIFACGKFNDNLKHNIVELLFKFNNSYAFEYLKKNYPDEAEKISEDYFKIYFEKQKFKTENHIYYLYNFTEYAFVNNNKKMIEKIITKLRTTKSWKMISGSFENQIFRKYNVNI